MSTPETPNVESPKVNDEHFEVGKSFGLGAPFTTKDFKKRYKDRFPKRPKSSMMPADKSGVEHNKGNKQRNHFFNCIADEIYEFIGDPKFDQSAFRVATAVRELESRYGAPKASKGKYVLAFTTQDGREIGIEAQEARVQIWLENHPAPPTNLEMESYTAEQGRNSNLPKRLRNKPSRALQAKGFPIPVFKAIPKLTSELTELLDWYSGKASPALTISRIIFEAAVSHYERLGPDRVLEIYDEFRPSDDYFVRSTFPRQHGPFPTKVIVALCNALNINGQLEQANSRDERIKDVTDVNEGFSKPASAGAVLANSGFMIVDQDDDPIELQVKPNLTSEVERFRLLALNYYIEPASEDGKAEVQISASALCKEGGNPANYLDACNAISDPVFAEMAGVDPPTHTEPPDSETTVFTFNLVHRGIKGTMKMPNSQLIPTPFTTNLILYGPPGTGKTYRTVSEAVRLCLQLDEHNAILREKSRRKDLKAEYDKLVLEERIQFVTFHQSFSYEDFVEGLRPSTEDTEGDQGGKNSSGGFSLKVHDGLFKRISERARQDSGKSLGLRLDRTRRIFKLSLTGSNKGDALKQLLDGRKIFWKHGGDIDWSSEQYDDFDGVRRGWQANHPDDCGSGADVTGTFLFRSAIADGDYVVLTMGPDKIVALGQVKGPYEYTESTQAAHHTRPVTWLWSAPGGVDRNTFYSKQFNASEPIHRLTSEVIKWDALEAIVFGNDAAKSLSDGRPYVLVIDEINRGNISKIFGELITLLEPDKRLGRQNEIQLRLPYSGDRFGVPSNLHIIGTMNTADRSIALLDTALRRRFSFKEMMPDIEAIDAVVDGIDLRRLLKTLNERIEYMFDREHQIGHAYFTDCKTEADIKEVIKDKVIPLLGEYFFDDWSKVATVLGDHGSSSQTYFLNAEKVAAPNLSNNEESMEAKVRWVAKSEPDLSEYKI